MLTGLNTPSDKEPNPECRDMVAFGMVTVRPTTGSALELDQCQQASCQHLVGTCLVFLNWQFEWNVNKKGGEEDVLRHGCVCGGWDCTLKIL